MQDAILAHSSLRLLADQLAAAGYYCLRFDYPGTGDSGDEPISSPDAYWDVWLNSVDAAANYLKDASGARRLIFCGLRFGAALALLAGSRRDDVDGFLLLAPVIRGYSYRRQILFERQLVSGQSASNSRELLIDEFCFGPATLTHLDQLDLHTIRLKAGQKIGLHAQAPSRIARKCVAAWRRDGAEVTEGGWKGLEPLVRQYASGECPLADFGDCLNWIRKSFWDEHHQGRGRTMPSLPAQLRTVSHVETPVWFGRSARLFGILCRPRDKECSTVVLICSAARDPHYGGARQCTSFARRLADANISSLRFDFAGLGDSAHAPGKEALLSSPYANRAEDIGAAVDKLSQMGFTKFAIQGLCSGAFHALQAAQFDRRLLALLLVNIQLFEAPRTMEDEYFEMSIRGKRLSHFLIKLFSLSSLKNLVRGKVPVRRIFCEQASQIGEWVRGFARGPSKQHEEAGPGLQTLTLLGKWGVRTLFLFSPGDREMSAFTREFGPAGERLPPGAQMQVVAGMDHGLRLPEGRRAAQERMVKYIRELFC
jgi:pimeloyl-ACP methyl ester carboxylesterase